MDTMHCDGCDHDVDHLVQYRVQAADGEIYNAHWCDDCALVARVDRPDDRIVALTA